jgi:hypothetical protein
LKQDYAGAISATSLFLVFRIEVGEKGMIGGTAIEIYVFDK